MNKKKILTSSLVLAMSLGVVGPMVNTLSNDNISPFISEAYAAGKVIGLGEGRTLEVLEEPKARNPVSVRRQISGLKIKLKGFKSGDELALFDQRAIRESKDRNFDNSKPYLVHANIFSTGLDVIDKNTNIKIGEISEDKKVIVFNDNIDKLESVDVHFGTFSWVSQNISYYGDEPNLSPVDLTIAARVRFKGDTYSEFKEISTVQISGDDLNLAGKGGRNWLGQGSAGHFISEDDGNYLVQFNTRYFFKRPTQKGDVYKLVYTIPDKLDLTNGEYINEDFVSNVLTVAYRMLDSDYQKGVFDRGWRDQDKTYTLKDANFDIKFNKKRNSTDDATILEYIITNNSDKLDGNYIYLYTKGFRYNVNAKNLDFNSETLFANLSDEGNPIKWSFEHSYKDDSGVVQKDISLGSLKQIYMKDGYLDAYGIWRFNKNKTLTGTEKIVEVGDKVKPSDFVLNPEKLPKDTKFEYVDKIPDTSKVISKDPIKIKATYPDGKIEEMTGLLTVIPVDKSKLVTINYELEDGTNVKSEEVLKVNAIKVATPETTAPKGYEIVNWVKK